MKRTFVTNLALVLILNLLVKPFWIFGIDRSVQNTVGAEEYGLYFSLFGFSVLINIILDLGITNFNNRSVAMDPGILKNYFSRMVPLKFLLAAVYAVIVIIAGLAVGYSERQFHLLYILIFNNFLLSFILYIRSNISGLQYFKTDSVLSVLDRLLMIIICSLLLWGNIAGSPFRISWFIYAQTVSYLVTLTAALLILFSKSGRIKLNFNFALALSILKESYPYALLILLMSFFNRIDSVMIERILPDGKEQAGIYAQAFRLLDAVVMFAFLFSGLLLPMFSRMLRNNESVASLLKLSYSLLIIPALTLVTVSVFYGNEIMDLLYNEHVEISSRIFTRLIFSFLFVSTTYIYGTLLTANGSLRELNILAGITVFLNIGLNLLLIPGLKAEGAAYASVVSQGFYAVSQVILAKRVFRLPNDLTNLFKLLGFSFLLVTGAYLLHCTGIHWSGGFFILTGLGALLAWVLRLITPKDLISILKGS